MELLSRKNEENITFCDNMDEPGEHYAKWNNPIKRKTNTIWFHSFVESKEQT